MKVIPRLQTWFKTLFLFGFLKAQGKTYMAVGQDEGIDIHHTSSRSVDVIRFLRSIPAYGGG
jgi:hypothetical protein